MGHDRLGMSGIFKIRNFSTPSVRRTGGDEKCVKGDGSVRDEAGVDDVRGGFKRQREHVAMEGSRGSHNDDEDEDTDSCADEDGLTSSETSLSSGSSVSSPAAQDTSVAFIVDNETVFVPSIIRISDTPFDPKGVHRGPFIARGSGDHQDPYILSIPLPVFRIFLWCLFPKTIPTRAPVSRQAWVWVMILADKWNFRELEGRARAELGLQHSCI